jgi:hypothetical protein
MALHCINGRYGNACASSTSCPSTRCSFDPNGGIGNRCTVNGNCYGYDQFKVSQRNFVWLPKVHRMQHLTLSGSIDQQKRLKLTVFSSAAAAKIILTGVVPCSERFWTLPVNWLYSVLPCSENFEIKQLQLIVFCSAAQRKFLTQK